MISGVVNTNLEATIPLELQDAHGQPQQVVAVIDTGFTGFLTLSPALIASLGLPWLCCQQGLLADGNTHVFHVYTAVVLWEGQPQTVETEAVDTGPLVGMGLIKGYDLRMRVENGGAVIIEPIP
jgi:clan AA aspartic protease